MTTDQPGDEDSVVATLIREAASLKAASKSAEALAKGAAASERARAVLGCGSRGYRASVNVIAAIYFDQHNYVTSRALLEWLSRTAAQSGDDVRFAAVVDSNRAHCLLREGYANEAGPLMADAFDRLVEHDPVAALESLHGIAESAYQLGSYQWSAEIHRRVLDMRREILPAGDPEIATSLYNLAGAVHRSGSPQGAVELFAEAARIWRGVYGDNHPHVFQALLDYAGALHLLGQFEEAAPIYRRLIELARTAGHESAGLLGELRSRLNGCLARVAFAPEAEPARVRSPDPFEALTARLDKVSAHSYRDCVRSFMARDYATSVTAALDHCQTTQRHDIIQLLIIALSRLGLDELSERVTDWALDVSSETPYQALLAFTAGRTDLSSARAVAVRGEIEHEHEFYAACRFSTLGDLNVANDMFERVCARRPRSFESILALSERLLRGVTVDAGAAPSRERIAGFRRSVERLHAIRALRDVQGEISRLGNAGQIDEVVSRSRALSASLAERGDTFAEEHATSLNNTAHILFSAGRYEESLPYYERSLTVLRSYSGSSSVLLGAATNNLGNLYSRLGRHADAVRLQVEALAERRTANGDSHPSVLLSLLDLGSVHEAAGSPAEARRCYQEALEIAGAALTELTPYVQRLRYSVARALASIDLDAARSALVDALRVWETTSGRRKGAQDLHLLGRLLLEAGHLNRAEAHLRDALGRLGTSPQLDRAVAAECLYDLGRVHEARGEVSDAAARYGEAVGYLSDATAPSILGAIVLGIARTGDQSKADDYAREALRIAEGAGDADLSAAAWHQIGATQARAGKINEARDSFQRALALRREGDSWGRVQDLVESTRLAILTGGLEPAETWLSEAEGLIEGGRSVPPSSSAVCLHLRGRMAIARRRPDEALDHLRAALDHQSRDVPSNTSLRGYILADLGPIFSARGEKRLARNLLNEAVSLLSADVVPIESGLVHMSLAACEYSLGLLVEASGSIRKAHDLLVSVLDADHVILGNLWLLSGRINLSAGAHQTAEAQLQRARQIFVQSQGPDATSVANVDLGLAVLQHLDGRWEESLATASLAAVVLESTDPRDDLPYKWQAFALAALDRKEAAIEKMLHRTILAVVNFQRVAATLPTADLSDACAHIGHVLDDLLSLAVDPGLSGFAQDVFAAVQRCKAIAAETFAVQREIVASSASEAVRVRWREIAELRTIIGRTLLQHPDEPLTRDEREHIAGWEARAAELERDLLRGEPTLDLSSRFRTPDATAIVARLSPGEMLIEYIRFEVVHFRHPTSSAIGDSGGGRYCAFALVRQTSGAPAVSLFDLGPAAAIEAKVQEFREAIVDRGALVKEYGDALRERLLDPIVAAMGEPSAMIVAADGALNAMPFDALTWTDGRWLLDVFPVSFVDVARDLLRSGDKPVWTRPIVMAAPDFNLRDEFAPEPSSSEGLAFGHLTGAEREGRDVAARLGVEPLMGASAVESTLRSVNSPRILHLATHGFFIPKARYEGRQDVFESISILNAPGEGAFVVEAKRPAGEEDSDWLVHPSRLENPLLRSGIVLAGANTWLMGDTLPVAAEDGIVTALDVTGLDLAGTAMVVLSACETGLGVTEAGNGVLGLRHAFLLAGASTVVVSLWKVADEATTLVMDAFYRRLLAGESRSNALRGAKVEIRARGFQDPVFWAAFVCVGDPSPLESAIGR